MSASSPTATLDNEYLAQLIARAETLPETLRGRLLEANRLYQEGLYGKAAERYEALLQEGLPPEVRADVLLQLIASLNWIKDERVFAYINLLEPVTDFQRALLSLRTGVALMDIAHDYKTALSWFDQACEQFAATGEKDWELRAMNNRAKCYHQMGMFEEARRELRTVYYIARRHGLRERMLVVTLNLGVLAEDEGNWEEAERYYRKAYEVAMDMGARRLQALCLYNLATLHHDQGFYGLAIEYYELALALYREMGAERDVAEKSARLEEALRGREQVLENLGRIVGTMTVRELRQRYIAGLVRSFLKVPGIPTREKLAERIGVTRQTIYKNIRDAVEAGLLPREAAADE
ncbi:MAG: tetratricopeptide repeat protein [Bacteroidetes bacterium]|nr:tetratricopeptide repeat protein [Rhodothermia bacterium]MCS7155471.1 tetratricopeptide repeat protein [Bacteroidota bacterium]MCX7907436.1 tetratricopeptide repeat protein [Bacteroidota bacterium]MDW8138430.1 tetratricopeptide repeat protein [Bacteroidota bacterium]MDW8284633.1 tetratricopeptide repeat protein [Bacteroidota bacterium]